MRLILATSMNTLAHVHTNKENRLSAEVVDTSAPAVSKGSCLWPFSYTVEVEEDVVVGAVDVIVASRQVEPEIEVSHAD